jgi:hypothetical protein
VGTQNHFVFSNPTRMAPGRVSALCATTRGCLTSCSVAALGLRAHCQSGPTWKVIDLMSTTRLVGIAFEMAIVSLQHTDGIVTPTRDAVAKKIIELAKAGERDPGRLCDAALQALRPSPQVKVSDPTPLPSHASPLAPAGS